MLKQHLLLLLQLQLHQQHLMAMEETTIGGGPGLEETTIGGHLLLVMETMAMVEMVVEHQPQQMERPWCHCHWHQWLQWLQWLRWHQCLQRLQRQQHLEVEFADQLQHLVEHGQKQRPKWLQRPMPRERPRRSQNPRLRQFQVHILVLQQLFQLQLFQLMLVLIQMHMTQTLVLVVLIQMLLRLTQMQERL